MEKIFNYLMEYFPVVLSLIFTIITFVKTGKIKSYLGEMDEMIKYRSRNYRQTDETLKEKGQTFDCMQKSYKVDKKTNSLVETGDLVNLQEEIQSMAETALSKVLAKFLPDFDQDTVTQEYDKVTGDLDYLTEMLGEVEDIKQAYGLQEQMTLAEMQDFLIKRQETYKKEIKKNEKKIEEKIE